MILQDSTGPLGSFLFFFNFACIGLKKLLVCVQYIKRISVVDINELSRYVEAERLLNNLSCRPVDRYSIGELLFLTTRCRHVDGKLTVVADFTVTDLVKLRTLERHSYQMDD